MKQAPPLLSLPEVAAAAASPHYLVPLTPCLLPLIDTGQVERDEPAAGWLAGCCLGCFLRQAGRRAGGEGGACWLAAASLLAAGGKGQGGGETRGTVLVPAAAPPWLPCSQQAAATAGTGWLRPLLSL